MLEERGVVVDHSTIVRWTQRYASEIERRLRWHCRRPAWRSWRGDETYIRVKGRWTDLYRAADKGDAAIEFFFPPRNAKAPKRFLGKALRGLKREQLSPGRVWGAAV